jgi:hypothetical protein
VDQEKREAGKSGLFLFCTELFAAVLLVAVTVPIAVIPVVVAIAIIPIATLVGFAQLVALVICLAAVVTVVLAGLVEAMLGAGDAPAAVIPIGGLRCGSAREKEQTAQRGGRQRGLAENAP